MNLPIICLGIVGFARLAQALGDSIDSGTSAASAVPTPAKKQRTGAEKGPATAEYDDGDDVD